MMVVATVTQNFQVLKTCPSNAKSSPIIRSNGNINFENNFPNAKYLNKLTKTAKLNKRILLLEQPIVKFTSDSIALLPRNQIDAHKDEFDYYEHLNESLYEKKLLKSKRAKLISQLNESRSLSSLSNHNPNTTLSINDENSLIFTSDKFHYATKSCDLTSFINSLTNTRRKSTLSFASPRVSSSSIPNSRKYSQIITKKLVEIKTPRVELYYDGPYCCLSPTTDGLFRYNTDLQRSQSVLYPRAKSASPYKTRPLGGRSVKVQNRPHTAEDIDASNYRACNTPIIIENDRNSMNYELLNNLQDVNNNQEFIGSVINPNTQNNTNATVTPRNDDDNFIKLNPSSTPELYEYRDYIDSKKVNSKISIKSSDSKNSKSKKKNSLKKSEKPTLANSKQHNLDSDDKQENSQKSVTGISQQQTVTSKEKRQKQVKQRQTSDYLDLENNLLETINVSSMQNANNPKTQIDNDKQRNLIDNDIQSSFDITKITSFNNNLSYPNNNSDTMSLRKTKNSNGSSEPQTLIGKEIEKEFSNNTQNTSNYTNYNRFSSIRHQIPLAPQNTNIVPTNSKEDYIYVKPTLIQMLDFELSETKKDELTAREIFSTLKEVKINTNIGRLALSRNVCRFELPFDMKILEKIEPLDYLRKYCKISDRRKAFYKRVFDKLKIKHEKEDYLDASLLEESMMEVHSRSITKEQHDQILLLACLAPNTNVNYLTFTVLAALSERILYAKFVTEDTADLPDYQKDKIECADFGSLKSKLDGVHLKESMFILLEAIKNS